MLTATSGVTVLVSPRVKIGVIACTARTALKTVGPDCRTLIQTSQGGDVPKKEEIGYFFDAVRKLHHSDETPLRRDRKSYPGFFGHAAYQLDSGIVIVSVEVIRPQTSDRR